MTISYSITTTVEPVLEPVTVSQIKDHLRVTTNLDDVVLKNLAVAARQRVERETGRSLITQTKRMKFDCFPVYRTTPLHLLEGPVQSITSVSYNTSDGTDSTFTDFQTNFDENPALLFPDFNVEWPSDYDPDRRGVEIVYVAGYGDTHVDVPFELRQSLLLMCEILYDGPSPALERAYKALAHSQRVGLY